MGIALTGYPAPQFWANEEPFCAEIATVWNMQQTNITLNFFGLSKLFRPLNNVAMFQCFQIFMTKYLKVPQNLGSVHDSPPLASFVQI